MKAEFCPNVAKNRLFADGSGHSRGSTVDLTIVKPPPRPQHPYRLGEPLAPCFSPDRLRITGEARANRQLLKVTLAEAGFRNLAEERWHYTFAGKLSRTPTFDFPVTRPSLTCAPSHRIAFRGRNAGRGRRQADRV